MRETSNIGQTGVESVRIANMKICDLPIRESVLAAAQLPLVEDAIRQTEILAILAGRPKQRVEYVQSRIKECRENIERIQQMKTQQNKMIQEYTSHISLCKFRDKEISKLNKDSRNYKKKVNELNRKFPPYNVVKMQQQITQSNEAIERADEVINKENDSIIELSELLNKCLERDSELKKLGAKVAVG